MRNRRGRIALFLLLLIAAVGIAAPWIAPYDPVVQPDVGAGANLPPLTRMYLIELEYGTRLADSVERVPEGLRMERLGHISVLPVEQVFNLTPGGVDDTRFFLLGTDRFSRDVFSRVLHGARISLWIGSLSLLLALLLGLGVGTLAALGGKFFDHLLMRLVDGLMTFPWLIVLIALAAIFPPDTGMLILLLGGTSWMSLSRLVRSELLSLRERDYVLVARGLGMSEGRIFLRHLLPNMLTPILVAATLRIAGLILGEAALSFLGFGVQVPQPSWGNMIADGRGELHRAWWVVVFPGIALSMTIITINLASDSLRDLLDPRNS